MLEIKLSKRQKQVYEKALLGFNAQEMGEIFQINPKNVQHHLQLVYLKHGVRSLHQLLSKRIAYLENKLHEAGVDYD